jgi:succinate dehydrogenase/fumarate reductase flavoprotein subunit
MCAALEASDSKAEVLLVEKTKILGGSTSISRARSWCNSVCRNFPKKSYGIRDSPELFLRDLEKAAGFESLFPYVQEDKVFIERRRI